MLKRLFTRSNLSRKSLTLKHNGSTEVDGKPMWHRVSGQNLFI